MMIAEFNSSFIISHSSFSLRASQVADRLERLIGGLDRLAIELEGALRLDQRHQFFHRIDVAGLEKSLQDLARTVLAGLAVDRRAGGVGFLIETSANEAESLWID